MRPLDSMLDLFRRLSDDDQRRLLREFTRFRLAETARRIAGAPAPSTQPPTPISDEELNQLVHEARREVLRARGL